MSVMLGLASHHFELLSDESIALLPVVGGSLSMALACTMNEKGVRCNPVLDNQSSIWFFCLLTPSQVFTLLLLGKFLL